MGIDWGFFKRHPFITGGIVLIGIVIFVVISRGRSNGDAIYTAASGPSDASILAGAQTAMAQLSSATKLESDRIASNAAIELATITADYKALEAAYTKDVALSGFETQKFLAQTQTQAQLEAIRTNTNAALEVAQLQANLAGMAQTQQWQLDFYQAEAAREAVAYDYTRNVLNDARDDAITGDLIKLLSTQQSKAA